ncbi:DNA/RNA nuclease SfsA [Bacillus sp. B1-b2]|nr:DNA/RNA nuclease SfsA [Bacillus sp. B1-b2]
MKQNLLLNFPDELIEMTFLERPNRFILHCFSNETKEIERVHLADPGRLIELLREGSTIYVLPSKNPNRKTKWTAVYVEWNGKFVSINTTYPNKLVELVLKQNKIKELAFYHWVKSEYTYGHSRWDFLLENELGEQLLLEVKSVTMGKDGIGLFPDAVTKRGTKHVTELTSIVKDGSIKGAILFIVQREDVSIVTGATSIDPDFSQSLQDAEKAGVLLLSYTCVLSEEGIALGNSIPVDPYLSLS